MNVVTMGGLVFGLGLLIYKGIDWWPGRKRFMVNPLNASQDLLALAYGWCYGMLAILCIGGLIGATADFVLWGANWLGDAAMVWGIGGEYRYDVTRPVVSALTAGGNCMFALLTFAYAALIKKSKDTRSDILTGTVSGICLGLSKGIAGAAAVPLASLVNVAGAWISTEVIV